MHDHARVADADSLGSVEFVKGHGTENDFVVLPDPDGAIDLDAGGGALVRALCHRRRGIGADGVLRVARTDSPAAAVAGIDAGAATWFMDYRNADGSLAEMCGNGMRVFARHLVDAGLVAPGTHPVATRAGTRWVTVDHTGPVTVDMGPAADRARVVDGRRRGRALRRRGRRRQPAPRLRDVHRSSTPSTSPARRGSTPRSSRTASTSRCSPR